MGDRADLEVVLASHFLLISVSTFEKRRTIDLFKTIATKLDVALSYWTATDGLNAVFGEPIFNADELRLAGDSVDGSTPRTSADPEAALRVTCNSRQSGIVMLLDFHPFLDEPVHIRLLKEIAQDHELRKQKLVFVSHYVRLPDELSRFSAGFALKLPTSTERARIVAEEAEIWSTRSRGQRIRADKKSVSALVNNLSGLTCTDARCLVRNTIYDDGAITASDVAEVANAKHTLIGQKGLLSFEFDTAHLSDIGGLPRSRNGSSSDARN